MSYFSPMVIKNDAEINTQEAVQQVFTSISQPKSPFAARFDKPVARGTFGFPTLLKPNFTKSSMNTNDF